MASSKGSGWLSVFWCYIHLWLGHHLSHNISYIYFYCIPGAHSSNTLFLPCCSLPNLLPRRFMYCICCSLSSVEYPYTVYRSLSLTPFTSLTLTLLALSLLYNTCTYIMSISIPAIRYPKALIMVQKSTCCFIFLCCQRYV